MGIPTAPAAQAAGRFASAGPEALLDWAFRTFGRRIAVATSFGAEDVVLLDVARKVEPDAVFFAIDTGRLPEETFLVAEAWRERGARIRWYFPEHAAVEGLVNEAGAYSFRDGVEERKACCAVRKVEPLQRALSGLEAWITGLRRDQSPTRAQIASVEQDDAHGGIVKINPLTSWTSEQVWDHIRAHRLPYSALHDRGYPSVGCAPCTRAVQPGEHPRAGRWWWESPEHKECGLHRPSAAPRNASNAPGPAGEGAGGNA